MYEPSWRDVELFGYSCFLIMCIAGLLMIFVFITRECNEIFQSGDDCGVGHGWFGIAGGFFVIGVFSVWKMYSLVSVRK